MSIQSQIDRINTNIANAYDAVDIMGGTLPVTQNSANLPDAIATLAQSDYIKLEWIESTGTQYIDTGITPDNNYIIEMTASNHSNDDTPFFGANTTWTTSTLLCYGVLDRIYFAGRDNDYISHNPTSATPYKITVSSSTFSVDNTSISMPTLGAINTTLKFFSGGNRIGKFKLYSAKVWNGNTLVGDYTPVIKKSDGEAGLYDNVSKTFFGNSGSGKFNTNNHDGYIQLEYIESTGMQYIDTGIYPNANTGIEADFAYVAITPNQQRLFGINSNISGYTEINISFYNNGSNPTKWAFSHNSGAIGNWTNTGVNADANRHTLTYNKQNDGKLVIKTGSTTNYNSTMGGTIGITSQYTLPIFCELNGSQLIYKNFSQVRLYSFKIYDGNTLVRDYIPAMRNTDYEVGLYDQVNNIFYGNAGHGSFTPGIKINGYSQLFWIKSTGSAWFDTGVSGGSKMEYSIVLNTLGARNKNYEQYFSGDIYPVSHKIYLNGTSGTSPVCAQQTGGNNWSGTSSNTLNIYTNADKKQTVSFESDGKLYVATLTADSGVNLKGTGLNNGWGTLSYYVFNSHEENTLPSSMQLLHLKMKKDTDTVRFYIPMQRESDSVKGAYDLVNNTFTPSVTNTAFTRSSVLITDDGTNSPYYYTPVVVPTPSTKSGSIANQIDRINENIANAYDVCRQIGRTMPPIENSFYLEPTILEQRFQTFTVTFENYDGTVLQTIQCYYGQTPVYSGSTPTKPSDIIYDYTFSGWNNLMPVTGNTTYTAQYTSSLRNYTVVWKNYDNSTLLTSTYHYGDLPTYTGQTPTKPYDGYTYTFDSWLPTITTVTGDTSYVAQYTASVEASTEMCYKISNNTLYLREGSKSGYTDCSTILTNPLTTTIPWYENTSITTVNIETPIKPRSMTNWFYGLENVTNFVNLTNIITDLVTRMYRVFGNCTKVTQLSVAHFKTSNVTSMNGIFGGCNRLISLDLSGYDTSNVTDMSYMFANCHRLSSLDISNFNTSKVTNMTYMFYGCASLVSLDLTNFNTTSVSGSMSCMFYDMLSLKYLDLSSFNTDKIWNNSFDQQYGHSLGQYIFTGTTGVVTAYVRNNAEKTRWDNAVWTSTSPSGGITWRFTVKS